MTNKAPPYWMRQTLADLIRHEGIREFAYPDPLSVLATKHRKEKWGFVPASVILAKLGEKPSRGAPWTVGVGFTRGVTYETRMSREMAIQKLEQEVIEHLWVLDKMAPNWLQMPDVVKSVLANMAFNMGGRLMQFKATFKLLNAGDFAAAGRNLRASAWYKQVGDRAKELIERLETGSVQRQFIVN